MVFSPQNFGSRITAPKVNDNIPTNFTYSFKKYIGKKDVINVSKFLETEKKGIPMMCLTGPLKYSPKTENNNTPIAVNQKTIEFDDRA